MHRALLNELRLEWTILPLAPLLISASEGRFVRSAHPDTGTPTAYLPGGTLKGLLRSASSGMVESAGQFVCTAMQPCQDRENVKAARGPAALVKAHCPVCRVFGSRALKGHLAITDSYPARPLDDLHMHTLGNGETCEMVNGESFNGALILQNFERWQMALLGAVLGQVNAGHLLIGANRNAGMGRALIRFDAAAITYFGFYPNQTWALFSERIHGIGQLLGAVSRTSAKTSPSADSGALFPDVADERDLPLGATFDSGFGFARALYQHEDPRLIHPTIEQLFFRQMPAWERFFTTEPGQAP